MVTDQPFRESVVAPSGATVTAALRIGSQLRQSMADPFQDRNAPVSLFDMLRL
jgi:hypothetical protein